MPDLLSAAGLSEFDIGTLRVRPRERVVQSELATLTLEPLVMQLLLILSRRAGQLVSRRALFELCWGEAPVGDDSLNRLIAVLRKALQSTTGGTLKIETVAGAGYVLRLSGSEAGNAAGHDDDAEVRRAISAAFDSWRLGLPEPDHLTLERLRRACAIDPANARAWGMLALLCRHAAEYAEPGATVEFVRDCEHAVRQATILDPGQAEALTALIGVVPLFGRWANGRNRLLEILRRTPHCLAAADELAVLEMATGRVRVAKEIRDSLLVDDPLSASFCYKSIYQHWSVGDLVGMDHVGDRAIQLWPTHPAVWLARMWTLAHTDRVTAAMAMLDDAAVRPGVPAPALAFFRQVLIAAADGGQALVEQAVAASKRVALTGPANALASMFALNLLDRHDEAFAVAEGYYLRSGAGPVPVRHTKAEMSLNEQHRRLTQILFTPVFGTLRTEPRFLSLCDRIGLSRYWDENDLEPDFLSRSERPQEPELD